MFSKKTKPLIFLLLITFLFAINSANSESVWSLAKDKEAQASIDKGKAYLDNGKFDEAIAEFIRLAQLHPDNAFIYSYLGIAYQKKGDFDNAITNYSKSIQFYPKDYTVYSLRGNAYLKKSNYDQAIADFNKYLQMEAKDGNVYFARAIAYFYKKEYDKAWDDVHKAQALGVNIPSNFLEDLRKASGREK